MAQFFDDLEQVRNRDSNLPQAGFWGVSGICPVSAFYIRGMSRKNTSPVTGGSGVFLGKCLAEISLDSRLVISYCPLGLDRHTLL